MQQGQKFTYTPKFIIKPKTGGRYLVLFEFNYRTHFVLDVMIR